MKRTLKLLSVAALLGLGVTGLAACGETSSSTVPGPSIQAPAEATSVNYGETLQLSAVGFEGAVSWTSSNTSIATVSAEGLVTGIIPGTVKITAIDEADNRAEIEISVVDPEATTSGTVTVDYDNLPTEILVDSKIDMDQYAEVKKVTNWYLTTEDTDIVKIEGHTIVGIAPGSYLVTLHAGRTARAIQGTVITEGKIDFNTAFDDVSENFIGYSPFSGMYEFASNYYATIYSQNPDGSYVFSGGIKQVSAIHGEQVATRRASDADGTVATTGDSFLNHKPGTFKVKAGYGRSREAVAGAAPTVKGSDFVELFYKGTSLDSYYLSESNGRVAALMNYYAPGAWDNIVYYVEAGGYTVDGVTAVYSKEGNFFDFYPSVGNGTFVSSVEIAGEAQPIDAVIEISDIGNVKIEEADAWVAKPVAPEPIDISPLDNFFDGIMEKKTWTEHAIGRWYNTQTDEQVPTPEGMTFVNTHQDIWSQFEITKYGNANATYTLYEGLNNNHAWGESDPNIANNTAVGYYVKDGSLYNVTGTNNPETSTTTWNKDDAPVQGMSDIKDMFDTSLTPCNVFTGADIELGGQSLGATMLELTSFYDKKTTDTGTTYYFNHNGPDTAIGTSNPGSEGTFYFGLAMADPIIAFYTAYYMVETGYIYDYVTMGFDLTTAADELTYWIDFNYSAAIHYEIRITLSDVGTDNVPQSLKDKTAATPAA